MATRNQDGVLVYETNSKGLVVFGSAGSAPTTPNTYGNGCILIISGKVYNNVGSVASPSFETMDDLVEGAPLTLTNTTTDNTVSVDQNGNVGSDVSTDGAVHVENTGNTGIGLGVYTNIGAEAASPLVKFMSDNVAHTDAVLEIENDGVGECLKISPDGNVAANKAAVYVINDTTDQTSGAGLVWIRDARTGSTRPTLFIRNAGTGPALSIDMDGSAQALIIDHDDSGNAGPSVQITRDGNVATDVVGLKIEVNNAGAGSVVGIDFSAMSDGEALFKLTSTDTDLSSKSPETDAEAGWFPVDVGGTVYAVPIYALS